MLNFIFKTLPHVIVRPSVRTLPFLHKLFSLQHHHPLSACSKSLNQHSFTVSYLINSCGFPPEKALSASKYINFETPEKPNSILDLFKNHGFTQSQISFIVRKYPPILLCKPEKTLLPKLEYFNSVGISSTELAKIITAKPSLLKCSLENKIIPSFNFVRTLLKSDAKTFKAVKRNLAILVYNLETYVAPNIEILRELSVPELNIVYIFTSQPRAFMIDTIKFREIVEEVKKMGFNPLRLNFVQAVHARRAMSKLTWEKKMEVYKRWGWSEDDILVAFGKHPGCMMASEDKIMGVMDFLVNKMGWESSVLVRVPLLISMSLAKRIVPRCSVYQVLLAKGLIKKDQSLSKLFLYPEKQFMDHIMKCYKEEAPELLKLYQEKLDLSK